MGVEVFPELFSDQEEPGGEAGWGGPMAHPVAFLGGWEGPWGMF